MGVFIASAVLEGKLDAPFKVLPRIERPTETALEVGDQVFMDVSELRKMAPSSSDALSTFWAKHSCALVYHLRMLLSRSRLLVPFGPPDAGKSTIIKKAFGITKIR